MAERETNQNCDAGKNCSALLAALSAKSAYFTQC
jgi:hypothetical protein